MQNKTEQKNVEHFDYLDGWRGCAILLLLVGHFFPIPGINFARVGVDLFFVLSGLLMCRLLFIKKVPIKVFYLRRIARIFPAFFFYVFLTLTYFFFTNQVIDLKETITASLFIYNYFLDQIGQPAMPFGHIWSLSVEEHTYLFLTGIAFVCRRQEWNARTFLSIAALISFLFGCYYWWRFGEEFYSIWCRSEVASFGIIFSGALLLHFSTRAKPTLSLPKLLICVCGIVVFNWWSMPNLVKNFLAVGLIAFLLNNLENAPRIVRHILSIAPLRYLGLWSYSIYLWQQVFYLAHHRTNMPAWQALTFALIFGLCSYYFVENPARHYLNRRWNRI